MSRDTLFLLPLLVVPLIVGACQSEGKLTGEVFIVTEGGSNVELGDLKVEAVPASEMEKHLEQKRRLAKEVTQEAARRATTLLDSLETLNSKFERARRELAKARRRQKSVDELESEVAQRLPAVNEIDKLYANSEAYLQQSPFGAKIKDIERGEAVTPINREEDFYIVSYSGKRGYVYAHYLLTEEQYESHKKNQREINSIIGNKERRYKEALAKCKNVKESLVTDMPIESEELQIGEQIELLEIMNENDVNAADLQAPEFIEVTSRFRRFDYYFQDLPKPKEADRTNSSGEFELTLTQGTPYYLVAEGRRSIGDETEKYYWMVETTLEGAKSEVILSNSNIDTELPDSLNVVTDAPVDSERLIESVTACE
jgi:hypothetical protein